MADIADRGHKEAARHPPGHAIGSHGSAWKSPELGLAGARMRLDCAFGGTAMYVLGECLVDPETRRVSRGSEVVRLTPKAMRVLVALCEARGRVLARGELLDEVWPEVTVGEEVLTHAVAELRRALGDDRRRPRYIETLYKTGYRLLVEPLAPESSAGFEDLDHYVAYLEGCELFFRGGERNVTRAAAAFAGILDADPTYALASAGLAKCLFFMDRYFGRAGGDRGRMLLCGRQAVAYDSGAPEAHAALGLALTASGQDDLGLESFARAVRLNRHLPETHYLLGRACFARGDYRIAATALERAATLRSDDFHSLALASKARRALGEEARSRADLVMARRRVDLRLEASPEDRRALCDRVCISIEIGEAERGIETALGLLEDSDSHHFYLVCGLARAGEIGPALDCLESVVEAGFSHAAWADHDRDIDPLRAEPRFRRLLAEVPRP